MTHTDAIAGIRGPSWDGLPLKEFGFAVVKQIWTQYAPDVVAPKQLFVVYLNFFSHIKLTSGSIGELSRGVKHLRMDLVLLAIGSGIRLEFKDVETAKKVMVAFNSVFKFCGGGTEEPIVTRL